MSEQPSLPGRDKNKPVVVMPKRAPPWVSQQGVLRRLHLKRSESANFIFATGDRAVVNPA